MISSIKIQAYEIHLGSNVLVENDLYFVVNHLAEVRYGINREDYGFAILYDLCAWRNQCEQRSKPNYRGVIWKETTATTIPATTAAATDTHSHTHTHKYVCIEQIING